MDLIQAFLDHSAATLALVSAASARGELESIAKQVHSLKGSARQLEIEVIGAISEQIELLAKKSQLREVQLLILRLEEESEAVRRGLDLYLRERCAEPARSAAPDAPRARVRARSRQKG